MTSGSQTFAVLIGVDHYAALPSGASLRGPVYDAQAWNRFVTEALGLPADQVIRLESPAGGGPSAGAQTSRATTANVKRAVDRMTDWLHDNPHGTGIFAFSGHGATEARSTGTEGALLRMCMEDFDPTDDPYGTSVGLGALNQQLKKEGVARRVTIITDCCYSNFELEPGGLGGSEHKVRNYHARMLLGSGEFSPAYGMCIDGHWRGVFTYALLSAMNLWQIQTEAGVRYLMGSHQDLLYRTRAILSAMGFDDQQPVYGGGPFVAALPFNYPERAAPRSAVSLMPNSPRQRWEVTSGTEYPGITTFGVPGGEYLFCWGTCGTQTTGSVETSGPGGAGPTLAADQFAMYQAAAVDFNGIDQLANYYNMTSSQNGSLQTTFDGTWSEPLPEQSSDMTWTQQTPEFSSENPAFGPTILGTDIEVYIQFFVTGQQITQVQFWTSQLTPENLTTPGLQITACSGGLAKVTENPDPNAEWACTQIDAFTPFAPA